jgi:uncharacterized protein (DUF952 family)
VPRIFHIASAADWRATRPSGSYRLSTRGRSLEQVGFIHCSYAEQVTRIANAFYSGVHGLVLLAIDPERVAAPIRAEAGEATDEQFPHIYGPLNADAVVQVVAFEPSDDGTFDLPASLR